MIHLCNIIIKSFLFIFRLRKRTEKEVTLPNETLGMETVGHKANMGFDNAIYTPAFTA